jgi:cbb3-type cytochrome oxidase maturation protein
MEAGSEALMSVFLILIPISLGLATAFVLLCLASIRGGQFDDLESPRWRILFDEAPVSRDEAPKSHDAAPMIPRNQTEDEADPDPQGSTLLRKKHETHPV